MEVLSSANAAAADDEAVAHKEEEEKVIYVADEGYFVHGKELEESTEYEADSTSFLTGGWRTMRHPRTSVKPPSSDPQQLEGQQRALVEKVEKLRQARADARIETRLLFASKLKQRSSGDSGPAFVAINAQNLGDSLSPLLSPAAKLEEAPIPPTQTGRIYWGDSSC
ncbi:hypothetical protein Esti_005567 [Eimeria stiedai]